jgi:hypothetical protein
MKMKRTEVYRRINQERAYQQKRWVDGKGEGDTSDEEKSIPEWVAYIEHHLDEAKLNLYHLHRDAALDSIRKIAALAVAALEVHGCPERKI